MREKLITKQKTLKVGSNNSHCQIFENKKMT